MAQYHVYENANPASMRTYPLLLDVQTPLLSGLSTRMVIPLGRKADFGRSILRNLNPVLEVLEVEYLVLTQQMAGIPEKFLGAEIADCAHARQEILSAIDFLITGF